MFKSSEIPELKTVFTRGAMISSLLFKQKTVNLGSGGRGKPEGRLTSRCTTMEEGQHKKGGKCLLSPLMSGKHSVSVGGRMVRCDGGDCKSRTVIYLFPCKLCGLCYVGKTDQELRKRVNGHGNCGDLEEGVGDPQPSGTPEARTRVPRSLSSVDFEAG